MLNVEEKQPGACLRCLGLVMDDDDAIRGRRDPWVECSLQSIPVPCCFPVMLKDRNMCKPADVAYMWWPYCVP